MPLNQEEKKTVIKEFAQAKGDTGSPEVQVAILSQEITKLSSHLEANRHDSPAKRGLLNKIAKRRRLLRHLALRNLGRYESLIQKVGLKK